MGKIELINFNIKSSFQCGGLLEEMLRLRYKGFILEEKYDAFVCDGMEFDQYDNPFSQYTVATLNGKVVACARLCRTDIPYMAKQVWGNQIPKKHLPESKDVYEFTRLYADTALPANVRNKFIRIMISYSYLHLQSQGVKAFYFVTYNSVFNTCKKLGFETEALCEIKIDGYDNIKYCMAKVTHENVENVAAIMNEIIESIEFAASVQVAA